MSNKRINERINKKAMLGIVALAVLVIVLGVLYVAFGEKPVEGSKSITIEVVNDEGESKMYEVKTDAEYLQQAMDEAGVQYTGYEGPYGFTVETINGISGIYETDGAYWGFFVNDEYCNYGISQQPIKDGDAFKIVYTLA